MTELTLVTNSNLQMNYIHPLLYFFYFHELIDMTMAYPSTGVIRSGSYITELSYISYNELVLRLSVNKNGL